MPGVIEHSTTRRVSRNGHRTSRATAGILLLCALQLSCVAERPLVMRFERGEWRAEPFSITSMRGQRAGARVSFELRLDGPARRRLTIEGTVEIDPQPTLVDGRWIEEGGSEDLSGKVSDAALDFFGGQGDRPSLGGRFTLSTDAAAVYRINLPATRLAAEW